ncbi:MAG: hypothetical protein CMH54_03925 [Myxococcales bacterium]|nr:hypothetical protein [Myxococcales bacterium]
MSYNEFHIHAGEIPANGRKLSFSRDSAWTQTILADGIYTVTGDIQFDGEATSRGQSVLLQLHVSVPLNFNCSRCGENSDLAYETDLSHLFVATQSDALSLPVDVELDPELDLSEGVGRKFDAEDAVLGAFAADIPIHPVCHPECTGMTKSMNTGGSKPIDPRLAPLLAIRESMQVAEADAQQ